MLGILSLIVWSLVLTHVLERASALPDRVVLFSALTEHVPSVDDASRVTLEDLVRGFYRVVARYGFMEMAPGEEQLFAALMRNCRNASLAFGLPPGEVMEVGMQSDL